MKNKIELIKGMGTTTWEIRKWKTDEDDYGFSRWEFWGDYAFLCIPYYNSYQYAPIKCRCELKGKDFEFGNDLITYKGRINKQRMSGQWFHHTNDESGEWYGILLPSKKRKKQKDDNIREMKFYELWFKIFGDWIKSGWSKAVIFINNKISKVATTYTNRCWKCHAPIESTKIENKFFAKLHEKWIGNEKCPIPRCNYFLCNDCHKCLCDPDSPWRKKRNTPPTSKSWVEVK